MVRKAVISLSAGGLKWCSPTVQCLVCIIVVVGNLVAGLEKKPNDTVESGLDNIIS